MIPDTCPSRATTGEKRLFNLFRGLLPDNFTVWYEPVVRGRYPDFTILADDFGLLIVEVKGWYPAQIRSATNEQVELSLLEGEQTRVEKVTHPIRQARDYMFRTIDLLKKRPPLVNPEGDYQGKVCFPCGYGVLLTNITREQLTKNGLDALFPANKVLCRDELEDLEKQRTDRATIGRLKGLFEVDFPFDPLTEEQLRLVHGTLHPEVVVPAPEPGPALAVLDREQEQTAKSLGDGHRIFFGVAGSGKTIILLARAKLLVDQDPTKRVLVLCYNTTLMTYLRHQLSGEPRYRSIHVSTYHAWATKLTGLEFDDERLHERLHEVTLQLTRAGKYDAIFIDEAVDFEPDWFRSCVNALRDGPDGDLLIALDGAQSLYGRPRGFTWASVGVRAKGRSKRLDQNYRNTREILDFAWGVTQAHGTPDESEESELQWVEPRGAKRTGPVPEDRASSIYAEEYAAVGGLVQRFREGGVPETEIAVLYVSSRGHTRLDGLRHSLARRGPCAGSTTRKTLA